MSEFRPNVACSEVCLQIRFYSSCRFDLILPLCTGGMAEPEGLFPPPSLSAKRVIVLSKENEGGIGGREGRDGTSGNRRQETDKTGRWMPSANIPNSSISCHLCLPLIFLRVPYPMSYISTCLCCCCYCCCCYCCCMCTRTSPIFCGLICLFIYHRPQ